MFPRSARFLTLVCVAFAAAGCASTGAPPGSAGTVGDDSERAAAVPPLYALLGEREALDLTSSQIAALDSIGTWLSSANGPLIDELFERGILRGDDPVLRDTDPPRIDRDGRPLLVEIGANNDAAEAAIQGILTDEQQTEVCRVFRRERRDRLSEVPRSTARLGVATGFGSPDVANYVWPWCDGDGET
jgi:hypothetical protein